MICKKNQNLYNAMLGKKSKFHFIPLLFASALCIINMKELEIIIKEKLFSYIVIKRILITNLILSILNYFNN